jgi:protein disulfide-isomerase
MEQGNFSPETVVAPLISYIDQFGAKDPENLWRLEMIVSQVYFERGKLAEALKYARASYESAPASVQPEIATAIKSIESRIPPKSKG